MPNSCQIPSFQFFQDNDTDNDLPVVRSVACAEKQGVCMQNARHCLNCSRLANREAFVERVKWWAEKIKLTELMTSMAAGTVHSTVHRSYADMYKELQRSIWSISPQNQNSSCQAFLARSRLLPSSVQSKD